MSALGVNRTRQDGGNDMNDPHRRGAPRHIAMLRFDAIKNLGLTLGCYRSFDDIVATDHVCRCAATAHPRRPPRDHDCRAPRLACRFATRAQSARYVALAVIACLLPIINPTWELLYYLVLLGPFALIGWGQVRVGRVGVSRPELALLFCYLALLTFIAVVPNPFRSTHWPVAMQYHIGSFIYFFVVLSSATLAYSWRTVVAVGTWTSGLWIVGMVWVWWQPDRNPELTARIAAAIGSDQRLFQLIFPNSIGFGLRIQEIVAFMIVAVILA